MSDTTLDRVRQVASDVLGVPAGGLTPASSPETVEAWDSVQHLSIILELEQTFGVHFEPEEMETMKDIGSIAELIDTKQRS